MCQTEKIHRPPTVLLAEDDPGHSYLIETNLRRSGITGPIVTFENGQEVIDYLFHDECGGHQSGHIKDCVVLLDLNMPVLDGFQVLRTIRSDNRTKHLPVIILTTSDHPREKELCKELECQAL